MQHDILSTPGFAVAIIGPDLLVKSANLAFVHLFKYPGVPHGLPAAELLNIRDRESFITQLVGVFEQHPFTARPFGFQCADGSSFLQGCQVIVVHEAKRKDDLAILWHVGVAAPEARLDQFQASILHQIQEGVVVVDTSDRIVYWNRSAEKIFNKPAALVLGRSSSILPFQNVFGDALMQLRNDATARLSGEWQLESGHWISFELSGWFSESGQLLGVLGLIRDVTYRKTMENELQQSEHLHRTMFQDSPLPMFIYDLESLRILDANSAACRFYEYSKEQFNRISVYDLRPEDEKTRFAGFIEALRSAPDHRDFQTMNWIHQTRTGRLKHVEVISHAVDYLGAKARLAIVRDISQDKLRAHQLRESEQRLQLLFELTEEMIVIYDEQLRIVTMNSRFVKAVQDIEKSTPEAGMHVTDFIRPEVAAFWEQQLKIAAGGERVVFDHKHINQDGETTFFSVVIRPYLIDSTIKGVVVFLKDTTRQRQTEYMLEASSQMARIGGWEYNVKKNLLSWTDTVYDIHEIPRGTPVTVEQAISFYEPDSLPVIQKRFTQILRDATPFDETLRLRTATGKSIWVRALGKAEVSNGEILVVKGTFQEVTKEVERQLELDRITERLETATEAARIGVWEFVSGEQTSFWSRTNFELHQIEPTPDLRMPLSWIDKLEPAEKQKIRDAFERCIKEKMPLDVVFRDTINDESRYFHVYGKPFFDETGALLRIVGITADITEMVRARMVLESALKEKEILLSEIHHRVKNNFTVITSLLGLHINNSSDPTLKNILIESRKRILSMALVHEKLYQNKTFSGISFDAYLNELLPLIKAGGEKTSESVQIQVNAAPVLVDIVKAVPLGLLVNELVSNSLKHAFKGGLFGTIQIELSASETDIVLIYRDDGKGFDFYGHLHSSETMGIVLINLLLRQLKAEHRLIKGKGFGLEIKIPLA